MRWNGSSGFRSEWLHDGERSFLFDLRWGCNGIQRDLSIKLWSAVKIILVELWLSYEGLRNCVTFNSENTHWLYFDFSNLLCVRFIIQAVSKKVPKVPQSTFDPVGHSFLFTLLAELRNTG